MPEHVTPVSPQAEAEAYHSRLTTAAAEAHRRHAAERHARDPVQLARAVRTVRFALEQGFIQLADLAPGDEQ